MDSAADAVDDAVAGLHHLVTSRDVTDAIHGHGPVGRFNARVAQVVTNGVGSMYCGYLFVLIAMVSFPAALTALIHGDTVTGVAWLSQSFIQLVCLPVILVSQNVNTAADDARAQTDHEILSTLHDINVQQLAILKKLESAS